MKKTILLFIALNIAIIGAAQTYHVISIQCQSDTIDTVSQVDYYVIKEGNNYYQKHDNEDNDYHKNYSIRIDYNNEVENYFLLIFGGITCRLNYIKENK